jgi:predicted permease
MIRDLVFGLRSLFRAPAFTLTALVALALGIGANSAIFSAVSPVLFKPLPFGDPEKAVAIVPQERNTSREWNFSWVTFQDFAGRQHSFDALAPLTRRSVVMTTASDPARVLAIYSTAGLFGVFDREPLLGRFLTPADDEPGAPPVAVLTHQAWKKWFNSDPQIIGRQVLVDGESFVITGVTPEDLKIPAFGPALYLPLHLNADIIQFGTHRGHHNLVLFGRIAKTATLETASADANAAFAAMEKEHEAETLRPTLIGLKQRIYGDTRPLALTLIAAVLLVLLIACANVAGLLLVRSTSRQREIAIRLALGASRARVVRQMLTESVLLSCAGAGLGLLVALWTLDGLKALAGNQLPAAGLDGQVLAFTATVGVLTGLLFGVVPALHASRVGLHESLKDAGNRASLSRNRRRAQALLIGVQVALAFALLAGAGLMFQSLYALARVDPGFKPDHLITVRLSLPDKLYPVERKLAYYQSALDQAAALPGVTSVATADPFPFSDGNSFNSAYPQGQEPPPGKMINPNMYEVSEGYFQTMGIPIKEGRTFLPEEQVRGKDHAIIISERLAKLWWPNESALGKQVHASGDMQTVVGVVGDVRHGSLDTDARMAFYVPWQHSAWMTQRLILRTSGPPEAVTGALRKMVRGLDANLPVPEPDLVVDMVESAASSRRLALVMLAAFAGMALLLSALGLWGLIAYAVGQRRQELAIRLALGAPNGHVIGLVLRQGLWLIGGGLIAGIALAVAGSRVLTALLYGIQPVDVLTYGGIAVVLGGVALLACFLPARAATKVDPNAALRA